MQISDEMKALEALARAYDHEEAACMGEPSPWVSADSEGDDEWKAERIVAARAGLDAYRSALSLPVQPVACENEAHDHPSHDWRLACLKCGVFCGTDLSTTPPVPPTKGLDALISCVEDAAIKTGDKDEILERIAGLTDQVLAMSKIAVGDVSALRSENARLKEELHALHRAVASFTVNA